MGGSLLSPCFSPFHLPYNAPGRKEREGKISIVEVLSEVYPFAGDADLTKMLRWVSEEPSLQGAERLVDQELAAAEQDEMASLFRV